MGPGHRLLGPKFRGCQARTEPLSRCPPQALCFLCPVSVWKAPTLQITAQFLTCTVPQPSPPPRGDQGGREGARGLPGEGWTPVDSTGRPPSPGEATVSVFWGSAHDFSAILLLKSPLMQSLWFTSNRIPVEQMVPKGTAGWRLSQHWCTGRYAAQLEDRRLQD